MYLARTGVFLVVFILTSGFFCCAQNDVQNSTQAIFGYSNMTSAEQSAAAELFQMANDDRASQNLPSLREDSALAGAAWQHAQRMVQSGTLSHQLPGEPDLIVRVQQAGVHCSTVAENVASGPTAARINNEWMHSASHRANLLDPRVNVVGIAVIQKHGELFAVEDFAREMAALTPAQQQRQVASLLTSHGLQVAANGASARAYCSGTPSQTRPLPKLVMKYSTVDLSRLPGKVEQGIGAGNYRRAVVGSCGAVNQNGFSAYQMVILLY